MGSEHAPGLRPWIEEAARGRPLSVDLMGADLLVLESQRLRPVPQPVDPVPVLHDRRKPALPHGRRYARNARLPQADRDQPDDRQIVQKAAGRPRGSPLAVGPDNPFAEAVAIREVLGILLKNSEKLKIGRPQLFLINNTLALLDGIVERGKITPDERRAWSTHAKLCYLQCFDNEASSG